MAPEAGPVRAPTKPPPSAHRIRHVDDTRNDTTTTPSSSSPPGRTARFVRSGLGVLSGLLAGFAALAAAELVSAVIRPESGPVAVVGGAVIDRTPPEVKDFAVRHFGTNDKLALQLGILAILTLFAAGLGLLALRLRRTGAGGVLLFGLIGTVAALSRPDAESTDVLPSLAGALAGAALLYALAGRLTVATAGPEAAPEAVTEPEPDPGRTTEPAAADPRPTTGPAAADPRPATGSGFDRRRFLGMATAAAALSAGAGELGRVLAAKGAHRAAASRSAVRIPAPASPAAPVPRGADLRIPGMKPFTTPNADFYRVDTALVVPADRRRHLAAADPRQGGRNTSCTSATRTCWTVS